MKFARIIVYVLLAAALLWVIGELFFEKQLELLFDDKEQSRPLEVDILRIVSPFEAYDYYPLILAPTVRTRMGNVYESLVVTDENLRLQPALALSWGMIDDLTWDFRLRPGVKFHDGSSFDAGDVVHTFEEAIGNEYSSFRELLESVEYVQRIDNLQVRIVTKKPDPLLLQKLSLLFVISAETDPDATKFIGTGPYKFVSREPNQKMVFEKFDDYWGESGSFRKVEVLYVPDRDQRVAMLVNGEVDFLDFVPYDDVPWIEGKGFPIVRVPSLGVSFLTFNSRAEVFKDFEVRQAFARAIDKEELLKILGTFVRPAEQYISIGVFGFDSELEGFLYDPQEAKKVLAGKSFQVQFLDGLQTLGEFLKKSMEAAGASMDVTFFSYDEVDQTIGSDLGFMVYKTDLGDAADFLKTVAHSDGANNLGYYSNPRVDELIDLSLVTLDQETRLSYLRDAMKIVVEGDPIGVPLFEDEDIYAFRDNLTMRPRIDSMYYFNNIIPK